MSYIILNIWYTWCFRRWLYSRLQVIYCVDSHTYFCKQ